MGPLGIVEAVELHAKHSSSVEYVRARTWLSAEEPLQFLKRALFKTGESAQLELTYEKLLKVCFVCKRLTHEMSMCPFQSKEPGRISKKGGSQKGASELSRKKGIVSRGKGKGISVNEPELGEGSSGRVLKRTEGSHSPHRGVRHAQDGFKWASTGTRSGNPRNQAEWRKKENRGEVQSHVLASKRTEVRLVVQAKEEDRAAAWKGFIKERELQDLEKFYRLLQSLRDLEIVAEGNPRRRVGLEAVILPGVVSLPGRRKCHLQFRKIRFSGLILEPEDEVFWTGTFCPAGSTTFVSFCPVDGS